ncbi:MBL fold metallo-hydrolase [Yimella sp. cx-51]|uniref:MBL fold metallo-hydrolase n=1 Tax=Yimella sp. cx-51 TaxID=2770551 RepID=UPI00165D921F|nr:MBL fold metallo-hydrolase [Yimella sp. cx-51]MBC9955791.1 MBL fold metallo-hydrolase [Yimella sp. cx-51]QTH37654.1 MBL fold metallo-hydrolase [Yimella sp. cx-51]
MSAELLAGKGSSKVERVITSGTFSLDGGTWDVDNNVYVIGDDSSCVVVDAAHEAGPILDAIGDRELTAILCTHSHDDHISAVTDVLAAHPNAQVRLHPDDRVLWDMTLSQPPSDELADGETIKVGELTLTVIHTPGHSPGAVCFSIPEAGVLLSGDTLFQGGPGATGRSYSSYDTITDSIRTKLFALPADTVVFTGHGDPTTIGDEAAASDGWERPEGA